MAWVLKVCFHTMWSGWCEEMVERINLETSQDLSKVQLLLIQHVQPDFLFSTRFFSTFWDTMQRNARYPLCLQMKCSIIGIMQMGNKIIMINYYTSCVGAAWNCGWTHQSFCKEQSVGDAHTGGEELYLLWWCNDHVVIIIITANDDHHMVIIIITFTCCFWSCFWRC